jgi:hypothetical protein
MYGLLMNDEVERIWKERVLFISRYYSGIRFEELRKTINDLSGNSKDPSPTCAVCFPEIHEAMIGVD